MNVWGGFFGKVPKKSAQDVTRALGESIREGRNTTDARTQKKVREDISKYIHALKVMLFTDSTENAEANAENVDELMRLSRKGDLLTLLAENLSLMEFETRKDAVQIFNNLLRRGVGDVHGSTIGANNGAILELLVSGYDNSEIALNCGSMLRECLRYESLTVLLLESPKFWRFFDLVELSDFDVASDAFASFKEVLTRHVNVSAAFIERNLDHFVTSYNNLLRSQNYVTRRQSLKLLGEMLLERANFKIMTSYIASPTNLRLIMNLLLDQRKNIQFEAFHVFKIFVANPNKPPDVRQILVRNKERMLSYLKDFLSDRKDEQFQEDRKVILEEVRKLS